MILGDFWSEVKIASEFWKFQQKWLRNVNNQDEKLMGKFLNALQSQNIVQNLTTVLSQMENI